MLGTVFIKLNYC